MFLVKFLYFNPAHEYSTNIAKISRDCGMPDYGIANPNCVSLVWDSELSQTSGRGMQSLFYQYFIDKFFVELASSKIDFFGTGAQLEYLSVLVSFLLGYYVCHQPL